MQGIPSLVSAAIGAANTAVSLTVDLANTKGIVAIAIHSATGTWAPTTFFAIRAENNRVLYQTTVDTARVRIFILGDTDGCPLDLSLTDNAAPTLVIPTLPGGVGASRPQTINAFVSAGGVGVAVSLIIVAESASL